MSRILLVALALSLALPGVALARPAPVTWCGTDEVTTDRVPNLEVSSDSQVRFVYAIPNDGADGFAATASGIATDAAWIDQWWQAQDPSRAPRFDRYSFPGCTTRFGALDIGFVRLPSAGSFYRSGNVFGRLNSDLQSTFPGAQKTVVYYDGPVQDPRLCGQSPSNEDVGGRFGISYVYVQSGCGVSPVGASTSAEVAAHELIHNLGALPPGAPHPCPNDLGHPCDSTADILYPFLTQSSTLDTVTLDVNRDDYYGHSGGWWDVQDSDWLAHLPTFPLTLAIAGSGSLVARTDHATLPCNNGCASLAVENDTVVTAAAVPSTGWKIGRWSGACTNVALSCALTVTGPASATMTFVRATVRVVVRVRGKGRVASTPAGIACTGTCSHTFPAETNVRLTASPLRGWRFAGWNGACTGRSRCALVNAGGTVGARFVRR